MAKYLITEQQKKLLDEVNLIKKLVNYGKEKLKKIKDTARDVLVGNPDY